MEAQYLLLCIFAGLYFASPIDCVSVELQSYNFPDHYIRTADYLNGGSVIISNQDEPEIWNMLSPGICNLAGTVSFCIGAQSNVCLRHRNNLVYAENNDRSHSFARDACFYPLADKWFPGHAAFESVTYPGGFLRHQGSRLKLHSYSRTTLFEKDASFRILEPGCKKYRSYNLPSYYFGLTGSAGYISTTPELWVPIRPGLSGHSGSVSFRSCNNTKKYLRHRDNELYSDTYEDSQLYRMDATFTERERFFHRTTAYESVNYPGRFIRHADFQLRLQAYDASSLYKKDASYFEQTNEGHE